MRLSLLDCMASGSISYKLLYKWLVCWIYLILKNDVTFMIFKRPNTINLPGLCSLKGCLMLGKWVNKGKVCWQLQFIIHNFQAITISNKNTISNKWTSSDMSSCTESHKSLIFKVTYLHLNLKLHICGVFSTASSVTRGIMKNCYYFAMAATKAATRTAINPRSPPYLTATGFVPLV